MKFIFAILCFVVASNEGLAEKCNADDMNHCVFKVGTVLEKLEIIQESEEDFISYCQKLEQEGQCLEGISKSCEADDPLISKLKSVFHLILSELCGENGKVFMDMVPCFAADEVAFIKCVQSEASPEDSLCKLAETMQCWAKLIKEKCKNGEDYGNALKTRMEIMKINNECSGAGYLTNSFLTFATAVLSVLIIRNKLQ